MDSKTATGQANDLTIEKDFFWGKNQMEKYHIGIGFSKTNQMDPL